MGTGSRGKRRQFGGSRGGDLEIQVIEQIRSQVMAHGGKRLPTCDITRSEYSFYLIPIPEMALFYQFLKISVLIQAKVIANHYSIISLFIVKKYKFKITQKCN